MGFVAGLPLFGLCYYVQKMFSCQSAAGDGDSS